jgi:SAM-dependent MidA family methyltransferase
VTDLDAPNELRRLIREAIAGAGGAIPFARFMELALYAPGLGYYERGRQAVGKRGDFYTSVSVGPLFGELVAFQFANWLAGLDGPVQIAEAGAHDGKLAADILPWLKRFQPALFDRLEYVIAEPSPARREWQATRLASVAGKVRWTDGFAPDSLRGIIFTNELIDAMPVHRLGWDAAKRAWFEWGVAAAADGFAWCRREHPPAPDLLALLPGLPAELQAVLPDGFSTEVSPAATAWWRHAAAALSEGWLVTADYGLLADEFFLPQRSAGTLRGYYQHRFADDLLARPGEQDLTAQVNFSALRQAGENAGLHTEAFVSQRQWLTQIMGRTGQHPGDFAPWDSARVRQFQTLTHPEHLGRAFSVLVQRRGSGRVST